MNAHVFTVMLAALCAHTTKGHAVGAPLNITFTLEGGPVNLNLIENPHISTDFTVILGQNGKLTNWTGKTEDFTAYQDQRHGASLLVRNRTTSDGQSEAVFTGIFRVDNKDYVLEPAHHPQSTRKRRSTTFDLGNLTSIAHVIYEADSKGLTFEHDTRFWEIVFRSETNVEKSRPVRSRVVRSVPNSAETSKQTYAVEILVAVDYPIYRRWYEYSSGPDDERRVEEAIENIRFYYAHVMNGIDLRYQSIDVPEYSIYVRLTGIYVAMTPEDSYWTEKSENKDEGYPRNFTHAYKALRDFQNWTIAAESLLPRFDHATLYSGNELFSNYYNDSTHREIAGLARFKGICTERRVSINQENGQYASIQTGAHELGHVLGAVHDGTSWVGCNTSDQYIMASSPGELTEDIFRNSFTFSPCSIRSFQEHLQYLTSENKNCLLNQIDHFNMEEMLGHLSTLAGQVYHPDVQCRMIYGDDSFYCAGASSDSEICPKMMCYDPVYERCSRYSEQRAAEGTTCGNHQWCIKGDCVYDDEAPAAPDRCLYGDFMDTFPGGQTCASVVTDTPWECYNEYWFGECCQSCANISDVSWQGCEYGDHEGSCDRIESRECYFERTRARCCATCKERETNDPECLYGDDASWCQNISARSCYVNSHVCCETCERMNSGNEECPYGDTASWCPEQDYRNCYGNNHMCCESCGEYFTGIVGCEYGDRDRFCTMADCESPSRWQACCLTCADVIETTTLTAPTTLPTTTTATTATPSSSCEYGDHESTCDQIESRECYFERTRARCCATCKERETKDPECLYGDEASWCQDISAQSCHPSNHTCCETCKLIHSGTEGRFFQVVAVISTLLINFLLQDGVI